VKKNFEVIVMEVQVAEKDPRYPVVVKYCGVCGLPLEYCQYGTNYAKCKIWIAENCPELDPSGNTETNNEETTKPVPISEPEKEQQEKVKKLPGGKVKKAETPEIVISRSSRTKRKWITTVTGVAAFGIKLDEASKTIRGKFACGANPAAKGKDEITIQGDVMYELYDLLIATYKGKIKEGDVYYLEEDGSKEVATSQNEKK